MVAMMLVLCLSNTQAIPIQGLNLSLTGVGVAFPLQVFIFRRNSLCLNVLNGINSVLSQCMCLIGGGLPRYFDGGVYG